MKSMTDFIMEQEAPASQVVEESFNENELVSNFMGVCAASANVTCVLECANIVEFCNANDIAVPSIIQESWADFWGSIKNFFKKIADWFKSLVKGTTAVFAKNKLTSLIAKLRTFDKSEKVGNEDIVKLACVARYIIGLLELFRSEICEKIMDAEADMNKDDRGDNQKLYVALEEAKKVTASIKDLNKWFTSKGTLAEDRLDEIAKMANLSTADVLVTIKSGIAYGDNANYTVENLIADLEAINALNIPSQGEKILKAFDVTVDKIDASFSHEVKDKQGNVKEVKVDRSAKDIQKIVKEAADAMAKFYDKVKENMIKVSDLAYKDSSVAADKKKDYDKELERANKDAGRKDLHKGDKIEP